MDSIKIKPFTNKDNYKAWRKLIKLLLDTKGIKIDDKNEEKLENKGKFIIFSYIEEKYLHYVINLETIIEIFEKLDFMYDFNIQGQDIKHVMNFFEMQYSGNILEDINKLQNIQFEITSKENKISEQTFMHKILNLLPEKFNTFKSIWNNIDVEKKNLDELTRRIKNELEFIKEDSIIESREILKGNEKRCFICNKPGHIARFCKNKKCDLCGKSGHSTDECYRNKICTRCSKKGHIKQFCRTYNSILLNSLSLLIDMVRFTNISVRIMIGSQNLAYNCGYFPAVSSIFRLLTCGAVIINLVSHCERVYYQRTRICNVIDHMIVNKNLSRESTEALQEFRNLVQNHPIEFNMANFFQLNYSLLVSIASVVVTYTIILLQSVN
uniref:Gustatory receptor n=2 Tax=Bombyx mori TaxID=7091 RepID=A0A8R2QTT3_BOMMO|nr:uncharacterized protein LOC105842431 isoform X2 [Bombyx mori]XP_037868569.1 uncharacterized protein LOC105842431 isoform X2 [Bombyx mori]